MEPRQKVLETLEQFAPRFVSITGFEWLAHWRTMSLEYATLKLCYNISNELLMGDTVTQLIEILSNTEQTQLLQDVQDDISNTPNDKHRMNEAFEIHLKLIDIKRKHQQGVESIWQKYPWLKKA